MMLLGDSLAAVVPFSLRDDRPSDLELCVIVFPLTVSAKQLTNRIYREECEADFTDKKHLPFPE